MQKEKRKTLGRTPNLPNVSIEGCGDEAFQLHFVCRGSRVFSIISEFPLNVVENFLNKMDISK
jgi:hypothetical protein